MSRVYLQIYYLSTFFALLQVPFDKPVVSLKECLTLFNREETLDLDNQWKCENCKDYRKAQKKFQYGLPSNSNYTT